jgi:hypothetical protein
VRSAGKGTARRLVWFDYTRRSLGMPRCWDLGFSFPHYPISFLVLQVVSPDQPGATLAYIWVGGFQAAGG